MIADWLSRSVPEEDPFGDDAEIGIPQFSNVEESSPVFLSTLSSTMPLLPGVNRCVRRLRQLVWWPKISNTVSKFVATCLACARMGPPPKVSHLFGVLSRPLPLQLVFLDVVGERICKGEGKMYFLVIIYHCTRFMVARSSSKPLTTEKIVKIMRTTWISIFMAPLAILTDRGSSFISKKFRNYCFNELRTTLVHTSPYYPQGNAVNESPHRAIDAMLASTTRNYHMEFENERSNGA